MTEETNLDPACEKCSYKKSELDYLRTLKVLVGTPAYGGMVNTNFMVSIGNVMLFCGHENIELVLVTVANESLITRARNSILTTFIDDESYTHLFFIDGDIGFKWDYLINLLLHKKDVVTGAYPMKAVDFASALKAKDWQEAQRKSIHYVINPQIKEGTVDQVDIVDGLLPVKDAGTGFMCISREAINQLLEAYGDDIEYFTDQTNVSNTGEVTQSKKAAYALFDTSIEKETGRYLSEDYTFCRRWQSIGGTIWLDPTIILDHYGTYCYRGYPYLNTMLNLDGTETASS